MPKKNQETFMTNKTPCFIFELKKRELEKNKSLFFIYNILKYSQDFLDFDILINPSQEILNEAKKYQEIIYIFKQ
jgi:hypothetical protein